MKISKKKVRHAIRKTRDFVVRYKFIFATVLVVLVVGVVGVCFASCSSESEIDISVTPGEGETVSTTEKSEGGGLFSLFSKKDETSEESTEEVVEENPVVLAYNADTKEGYMNNCVFLGDSRTVAAVNYSFISDDDAFAQVGISHPSVSKATITNNAGKDYTLQTYLASHQKPVVFVCYGVNGMYGISEEKYESSYEELVDEIISLAPNSNIVLMSIWPVDDNGTYKKSCQNSWIEKYNKFLLQMATDKGLHYLNVNEILTDGNGQMKREYNAGDGLHYAASAYTDIINYIIHHPVPGVSDEGDYKVKYVKPNTAYTKIVKQGTENTNVEPDIPAVVITQTPAQQDQDAIKRAEEEERQRRIKEAEEEERRKKEREKEKEREREAEEAKKKQQSTPTPTAVPTVAPTQTPTQTPSQDPPQTPSQPDITPTQAPDPTQAPTPEPTPTEAPSSESGGGESGGSDAGGEASPSAEGE